jgi:myo-inositol 2-dehydrogenase / D-chiro-inositol 1-dehydrogenase
MSSTNSSPRRRDLLASVGAGLMIVKPQTAFGSQANSAVEIGIVGCGGRGAWIGALFQEFSGARIVALADVVASRIPEIKTKLKVESARTFVGLKAYRELAASKLDAVVIETPTYAHPEQAAAVVAAGKHVYVAKPVAPDVPGCKLILESGRKAQGKTSFWVDFQFRARPIFQECIARIRQGDLGTPVLAHCSYHANRLPYKNVPGETAAQHRMRNWYFDIALSGDIIVEQNIHTIDAMCWLLDKAPVSAVGVTGRKARFDGDCNDHFAVIYTFPNDFTAEFSSTQCTKGIGGIIAHLYGSAGSAEMVYGKTAYIAGEKPWKGPEKDDTFRGGAIDNIKLFIDAVRAGKLLNNAEESVRSNLTAILGRTAAYRRTRVTWDEMMAANERLDPKLEGLG